MGKKADKTINCRIAVTSSSNC
nr:mutant ABC transporter related-protein [Bombyx mori]